MKSMVKAATTGSLQDVVQKTGLTLEQAMMDCEFVVVIDQSGSMSEDDTREGLERYDVAESELRKIQEMYPGKVAVVEFSNRPEFCYSGIPSRSGGTTDLTAALRFVKEFADGAFDIVVISDGEPDNQASALDIAATFSSPINTIYIGVKGGDGQKFLDRLAKASGGQRYVAEKPGELMPGIVGLLGDGGM